MITGELNEHAAQHLQSFLTPKDSEDQFKCQEIKVIEVFIFNYDGMYKRINTEG